jgi:hypothetical protein
MRHRSPLVILLGIVTLLANAHALTPVPPLPDSASGRDPTGLIAHEWGTFTSIADEDGQPVLWAPFAGPVDLPCFVKNVRYDLKGWLQGRVRMETPVIYFYAAKETTVDVDVRFMQGAMTEWYPQAEVTPPNVTPTTLMRSDFESRLSWKDVKVTPGASENFPTEPGANHYYVARETDAAPLQVGNEREKLLFYRGIGNFAPPLVATIDGDGRVLVRSIEGAPIGDVMLFDNRRGSTAFKTQRVSNSQTTFEPLPQSTAAVSPRQTLIDLLVSHGLYVREATAMVDTWHDSWFEEGTRLFYIVPQPFVDRILPLQISPAPDKIVRVFVGRLELLSESRIAAFTQALDTQDRKTLASYGRFFGPVADRARTLTDPRERATLDHKLTLAYQSLPRGGQVCQ